MIYYLLITNTLLTYSKSRSFDLQQIQNFGDPFFLLVREGETLAEVKKRIQSKLQVSDEEFSKVTL